MPHLYLPMLAQTTDSTATEVQAPAGVDADLAPVEAFESADGATPEASAQVPGAPDAPDAVDRSQPPGLFGGGNQIFLIVMVMLAVMFFISFRTSSKEKKKKAAMLSSLKKGDRVQTIGGIVGSVVEAREDKVIVKVDENSNTKMTFTRGAVHAVIEDKAD